MDIFKVAFRTSIFVMFIIGLSGCPFSRYPLISVEESITPVLSGRYCFDHSGTIRYSTKYCGWINIETTKNKGYKFVIKYDIDKMITDTGQLKGGETYYARVLSRPISNGVYKDWHILQSCENTRECKYFAVRKVKVEFFEVAVLDCADYCKERMDNQKALVKLFEELKKPAKKHFSFYTKRYLLEQSKARMEEQQKKRERNQGDL